MGFIRAVVWDYNHENNDMSPRISAGDLLFYYRLEKPKSGDVVVLQKAGEKYVGRVIAAGGDTVEITEDEKVKINGSKIVEMIFSMIHRNTKVTRSIH